MKNNIEELKTDKEILVQSYEMYKKTRGEMIDHNASYSMVKNIDNEIESITKKIEELTEQIENAQNQVQKHDISRKYLNPHLPNMYQMDNAIPLDFNPLRMNHFIVRFPESFRIEPYMIESVYFSDDSLNLSIREAEGVYPILPTKFKDIKKEKDFEVCVDILNSDGSIYYTTVYKGCSLDSVLKPYLAYNDSNVRTWQVSISYENEENLTALPNIFPDETANQKEND